MELQIRRFDIGPDETRTFEHGTFDVLRIGGMTIGRAVYEPGWRWSEHVGPVAGTATCQVEHLGMVVSGRAAIAMDEGPEVIVEPGDVFAVPPGHDSWIVGDQPYVSLHLLGAGEYAAAER